MQQAISEERRLAILADLARIQRPDIVLLLDFLTGILSDPRRDWVSVSWRDTRDQEELPPDGKVTRHAVGRQGVVEFSARYTYDREAVMTGTE